jgi:hypothetical protein
MGLYERVDSVIVSRDLRDASGKWQSSARGRLDESFRPGKSDLKLRIGRGDEVTEIETNIPTGASIAAQLILALAPECKWRQAALDHLEVIMANDAVPNGPMGYGKKLEDKSNG